MASWAELKNEIQVLLGTDTEWKEPELRLYANWAIRVYSDYFPRERTTALTTDGTLQEWSLPSDFLKVRLVECPANEFLEEISRKPGTAYYSTTSGYPNMWYTEGGSLHFTYPPASSDVLTLHYAASHTEMSALTDTFTVPTYHLELLALYAASRALARLMTDQGSLDRWKSKQMDAGNPEQNPITPLQVRYERMFWQRLFDSLPRGNVYFHRKGRGA